MSPAACEGRGFFFLRLNRKAKDGTLLTTKYNKTMKELIEILTNEDKSFDGLPTWVYVFAIPSALVLMCMIGGTLS